MNALAEAWPDHHDPEVDLSAASGTPIAGSPGSAVPDARSLPISSITVPARLRRLREDDVAMLRESIAEIGLREPISVCSATGDEAASGIEFVLVAGYHRLEACKRLSHDLIAAIIHTLTDDERQLWEVDENLCRAELTELDLGQHLLMRKQIYERMHPETRQHVAGARGANAKMRQGDATANLAIASFTSDTAAKTRRSARAIRRSIQRVEKIGAEVRQRIWCYPKIADKGSELDALASLDAGDQVRALDLVEAGECPSVKAAKLALHPQQPRSGKASEQGTQASDLHAAGARTDIAPAIGDTREQRAAARAAVAMLTECLGNRLDDFVVMWKTAGIEFGLVLRDWATLEKCVLVETRPALASPPQPEQSEQVQPLRPVSQATEAAMPEAFNDGGSPAAPIAFPGETQVETQDEQPASQDTPAPVSRPHPWAVQPTPLEPATSPKIPKPPPPASEPAAPLMTVWGAVPEKDKRATHDWVMCGYRLGYEAPAGTPQSFVDAWLEATEAEKKPFRVEMLPWKAAA